MAFGSMTVFAKTLDREENVEILLPENLGHTSSGKRYKTFWVMDHAAHGDVSSWIRNTKVAHYAVDRDIIVVLTHIHNVSCRLNDMIGNYPFYVANELRDILAELLPISRDGADHAIGGLSFGGYFSYYTAFKYPERFGMCFSLSSPLNVIMDDYRQMRFAGVSPEYIGDPESRRGTAFDLPYMVEKCWKEGVKLPKMVQMVGTEDMTRPANESFLEAVDRTGYDHIWINDPGWHQWPYWDRHIKIAMDLFLGGERGGGCNGKA